MATILKRVLLVSLFGLAATAQAKTYRCEGKVNFKPASYVVELNEVTGLASDSLWLMKVVNNSGTDGKTTSGVATAYFFDGPYTYDRDSRHFALNSEVLSVNPKTGEASFTSAERMAMPVNCVVTAE
jgi:hypothetical protein